MKSSKMRSAYTLILLLAANCCNCCWGLGVPSRTIRTTEAFYIPVNEALFNGTLFHDPDFGGDGRSLKFVASVKGKPDQPSWMTCIYSLQYKDGFIYGVPEHPGEETIQVIATNKDTYQTMTRLVTLRIEDTPRTERAKYEVQMRFSNMDVEDMFADDRVDRLVDIFKNRLWRGNGRIYITLIESSVRMGGRRPVDPNDKDGVVVRIGSTHTFSNHLDNLEMEVSALRIRMLESCPKERQTLAERDFRDEGFIPDWCTFRLLGENTDREPEGAAVAVGPSKPVDLTGDNEGFQPPSRHSQGRDLLFQFLLCIMLPTLLAIVLAAALSFIMFGRREGVEKRNRETPSVQMVQYASIHRASANLRSLAGSKRDGAITPSSTIPRSYTSSPVATGNRNSPFAPSLNLGFGIEK